MSASDFERGVDNCHKCGRYPDAEGKHECPFEPTLPPAEVPEEEPDEHLVAPAKK